MAPSDQEREVRQKILNLEKELADLRQGLCLVQDYHHDLEKAGDKQDAEEMIEQSLFKPLLQEDEVFGGIWKFHDEMLISDPHSLVPCLQMYEAFVAYCTRKGRTAARRPAFEFVFKKMGVNQDPGRGVWQGYRIRTDLT